MLHRIEERTAAWHEIRRKNVGGSEIAALFRAQADYQMSEYSLFMVKSGRIPPPPVDDGPGTRIWFGIKLEAQIAQMAADLYGWTIEKGGYCTDDTTPGMGASLDYLITAPGPDERAMGFTGPGVLQIKNIDWIQHKRTWDHDEPPPHILLQLQHEIACSGCTWGIIVGMVGGNELPAYRYSIRPKMVGEIRQRVGAFWTRVGERKPPLIDGSDSTADAISTLFPAIDDDRQVDLTSDNELPEICAGLVVATADRKEAEAREQELKNRLDEKMAGRKRGLCSGFAINGVLTKANPGTRAGDLPPDKIIGARRGSLWFRIKELTGVHA